MKLQNQLNAAFSLLLLIILTVTGYVIYSLIMDLLIQDEQRQLEQKGEILVNALSDRYENQHPSQLQEFLKEQDLQLFLYDRATDTILLSTLPDRVVQGFTRENNLADTSKQLWEYGTDKFVTSRILFYPERTNLELILLTPMSDLRSVQHNFFVRLLIVFIVGAAAAIFISYFLTNRLVTPLTRLNRQLKKIEERKFEEIQPIEATGEIKDVARSVYDMANELQRYISTQQIFFQNASHELKTPLMTIQGYAEGIKEKVFDEAETEKGLEVMVTEVARLKAIINEMTLLAKLDSEQEIYHPELVDIDSFINHIVERALPMTNEENVKLTYEINEQFTFRIDEEKMLRAVLNLVVNGFRYAAAEVKLTATKNNEQIVLTVEDDGKGVPEDLLPNIFHRFVKGKSGETGLGLAIARAIVEQSGGKITVGRSELGGALFKITF
ncbi:HAMP domain-containing histidine kinase [Virgibacillus sp. MSJ-26]|uniref:sensor histidine kinase n=1 Tax=Virgibacillus sp. MSJ-26 TaxID=2841522 RepID=UPI001C10DA96|nr:HAMP domain-containing sensor histidine kinase [Virgibacillus sp. MSJ-26]MBU5467534.1 HAMP domain-containing histidine kinase [Virgibacillus sp. MSJ-26]